MIRSYRTQQSGLFKAESCSQKRSVKNIEKVKSRQASMSILDQSPQKASETNCNQLYNYAIAKLEN